MGRGLNLCIVVGGRVSIHSVDPKTTADLKAVRAKTPQMERTGKWLTRHKVAIEISSNVVFIALVPLILRATVNYSAPLFFTLGFNDFIGSVTGSAGLTDVGWEVAAAAGLLDPNVSAYAGIDRLGALIGIATTDPQALSHPPTSVALGLPLAFVPYQWWVAFWIVGMLSALGLTLRLMSVPAWAAYPIALAIAVTRYGQVTLGTTWPLMGLLVALAWRCRSREVLAGTAIGLLAASRTIGGLLLLYPIARRQWRAVVTAFAVGASLLVVAILLERDVLSGFLSAGLASVNTNMARLIVTPAALFGYIGLPWAAAWALVLIVGAIALYRGQSFFWVLAWLSLALSPIAWPTSFPLGLPLAVSVWRTGRLGRSVVLLSTAPLAAATSGVVVVWPVFITLMAVALVLRPIEDPSDPKWPWLRTSRIRFRGVAV